MNIDEKKLKNILAEELNPRFKEQEKKFNSKINSKLQEQREEYQRYLGVLKEDFDSKVNVVCEQYGDIKKTQNQHTKMIGFLQENMVMMQETMKIMQENTEIMKADLEIIKNSVKRKVDYDEFEALSKRVLLLEAKVSR